MPDKKPDHVAAVKKFAPEADEAAIAGIVRHLGIALQSRDASLVASKDPVELARVRDGFMKKKLALTESDTELDAAIGEVMTTMKDVRDKSRVIVCYLLAEKFGKLEIFHPKK